jgi:hypothetical protein
MSVANNILKDNDNVNTPSQYVPGGRYRTGGIVIKTEDYVDPCSAYPQRQTQYVSTSGNTSTGATQAYGVHFADAGQSTNTLHHVVVNESALNLTPNAVASVLQEKVISLADNSSVSPAPTLGLYIGPNPVAVSPSCTNIPANRSTLTFMATGGDGSSPGNIQWVQAVVGDDQNGPTNNGAGCHFIYYPTPTNRVYLDSSGGGYNWSAGNSVVGAGGTDLTNGYCTIHALSSSFSTDPNNPNIVKLSLDMQVVPQGSSRKYLYMTAGDPQNNYRAWGSFGYWDVH